MRIIYSVIAGVLLLSWSAVTYAQDYMTRKGQVQFSSSTSAELIEATNNDVAAKLSAAGGKGLFIIPIKSFRFKKALMQEHFNENYMESDKYPKATYDFTVTDIETVDFTRPARYSVRTKGTMTIKNVKHDIEVPGYIVVADDKTIRIEADFSVVPAEYNIVIPKMMENKIAGSIRIKVNSSLNK